jgi:transcriptional regulator
MARDSLDLLRGTLDLLVLRTLSAGVMHGYDVARSIRERTGDEILVLEGALYPALHRLERRGLVASTWGYSDKQRKAKYYRLTARGRQQLSADVAQWQRYTRAVARVLAPEES